MSGLFLSGWHGLEVGKFPEVVCMKPSMFEGTGAVRRPFELMVSHGTPCCDGVPSTLDVLAAEALG